LSGKLISGLAAKAKVPVIAVCGINELSTEQLHTLGVTKVYSLVDEQVSREFAMNHTAELLTNIGRKIAEDYL
jgi:glycerate kinase